MGAGPMARDYAKVLDALKQHYVVIGRGEASAVEFEQLAGHKVERGGLALWLENVQEKPEAAIVSVGVEVLAETTLQLLGHGIKRILVEKPAGLDIHQIRQVAEMAAEQNAEVYVAYNRRFYSAVLAAEKIIADDGGVESFTFEVTEWAHVIAGIKKADGVKENWFMGNTTHVVDLAFYLGGQPSELCCFTAGQTGWHSRSANFAGAGRSVKGALFSYHGNWNAPGRWSVEVLTNRHRLIFRPMEKLQLQKIGSVAIEPCNIDDSLDTQFKPGLYRQVEAFLNGLPEGLCPISEHIENVRHYVEMAGYHA